MKFSLLIVGITFLVSVSSYTLSPHGVIVNVAADKSIVELAVEGLTSFRVSVSYNGSPTMIDSNMIDQHIDYAKFTISNSSSIVGLKTSFGEIQLNSDTGAFSMLDSKGNKITTTDKLSVKVGGQVKLHNDDSCINYQNNHDITDGQRTPGCPGGLADQTQQTCCTACNKDNNCKVWIFATDGGSEGKNCWLMKSISGIKSASGRVVGGTIPEPPVTIKLSLGRSDKALFYGSGANSGDSRHLPRTQSDPQVGNTDFYTPHYYTTDGYSALGVSSHLYTPGSLNHYPAPWNQETGKVTWTIAGKSVDLYLMPATTGSAGLSALWDLTGRPAVLPRYAYGFMACRWGWTDDKYIWDMLSRFRNGSFPLDAWISDFEWYTPSPDYNLPDQGKPDFKDFSYNPTTFPNPVAQLTSYHKDLNLRFGGIRKPRLGNSDSLTMAKRKHWTVDTSTFDNTPEFDSTPNSVNARNLNYTIDEVREWYAKQGAHYLDDGVDFWWNDEGEAFYFMFYYWNKAEVDMLAAHDPKKRFFSINRAYTQGMQRFGAATWTGDIGSTFNDLQNQPGYDLNWNMAGSMYVTCDTGGFHGSNPSPLLLTRWYQYAVFSPIMRVHSTRGQTPHFPFLFGDDAARAMRKALNLRYRLLSYHYSLGHQGYEAGGQPIMRPLLWEYNDDPACADLTSQWMDGPSILAAPVLQQDNAKSVYLPSGEWYEFNTTSILKGPQTLQLKNVAMDHIPVYIKAGAVIPLTPVIQHTGQLPGGYLEVQVYPGKDGSFTTFEDDGETKDYQKGISKRITFSWNDGDKTLSWKTDGDYKDSHIFTEVLATAFFADGRKQSTVQPLDQTGKISF